MFSNELTSRGSVTIQRADKLANVPLADAYAAGIRFLMPHLLYDNDLTVDPVGAYADAFSQSVPVVYWDAPYPLITGLRRPETQQLAHRIYGLMEQDYLGVCQISPANVFFNPASGRACRWERQEIKLLDFNRKKVGTLTTAQVEVRVSVLIVQYAEHVNELMASTWESGVAKQFQSVKALRPAVGLSGLTKIMESGDEHGLTAAVDSAELEDPTSDVVGVDPGVASDGGGEE